MIEYNFFKLEFLSFLCQRLIKRANMTNKKDLLTKLYNLYRRDMYLMAYSILRNRQDAEDVVQDAIIRISKKLDNIKELKCNKTRMYMVIIVRNLSYNVYNKRKGLILLEHEKLKTIPNDNELPVDESLIKEALHSEMKDYFKKLRPQYADILILCYYYELKIKDIARILNITENNAGVRLNRALVALRVVIEKEEKGNE